MALLETLSGPWKRARSVNQTSTSYVSKVPTLTDPVGDAGTAAGSSVIQFGPGAAQNSLLAVFYAAGSNNNTFNCRVVGWDLIGSDRDTWLFVPVTLAEFALTLGQSAGVSGRIIGSGELFADTITLTVGNDDVSVDIVSPADDTIAHVLMDFKGFQKVELSFNTNSSATSCNALYKTL